jgi:hypothetical protein
MYYMLQSVVGCFGLGSVLVTDGSVLDHWFEIGGRLLSTLLVSDVGFSRLRIGSNCTQNSGRDRQCLDQTEQISTAYGRPCPVLLPPLRLLGLAHAMTLRPKRSALLDAAEVHFVTTQGKLGSHGSFLQNDTGEPSDNHRLLLLATLVQTGLVQLCQFRRFRKIAKSDY